MNAHNPVDLTYGGGELCLWRGWAEEIAWGLVWLSHLPVYEMLKPMDGFSWGFVVVYNEKNNKNALV